MYDPEPERTPLNAKVAVGLVLFVGAGALYFFFGNSLRSRPPEGKPTPTAPPLLSGGNLYGVTAITGPWVVSPKISGKTRRVAARPGDAMVLWVADENI